MRILIAYATKTGTVAICAGLLAKEFPRYEVDLVNISEKHPEIDGYDLLIFGASIRMDKLDRRMYTYLEKNKDKLLSKAVAYFICNAYDDETDKYFAKCFPSKLIENSIIHDSFGGALKLENQKGFERFLVKIFLKSNEENDEFVKPNIFTEAICRFADDVKRYNI